MTILVTGATGTVSAKVVQQLVGRGAKVRALVRDPGKARFDPAVEVVQGEFLDVDAMRGALEGVRTLFLLNAVVPDEFTQALVALNLAREAGIQRIVYLSVIHGERYVNVPHFAGKLAVERMIRDMALPATILRPAYFIDNDASLKDALVGVGVYPMPVGAKGLAMVDTRDVAEVAALELLRRDAAAEPLPIETIELVGPDVLTGAALAAIWSQALGKPVAYAGDDAAALERTMRTFLPGWMAYDMRMMAERFQSEGMIPSPGAQERLTALLGRSLHDYQGFAAACAEQWRQP